MNDIIIYFLPVLLAGGALGIIFFGGLWLTVKKGLRAKQPGLIFIFSFVLRMAIVLAGFYYIGAGSWQKLVICLAGFLIARFAMTRFTQKLPSSKTIILNKENP